jgi:predicted nucleic acid-binding protein
VIILLDNTVLSNFALVERFELLITALEGEAIVTSQVLGEFLDGVGIGKLPDTDLEGLNVIELGNDEVSLFQALLAHVNVGESSCLAVAAKRDGKIITDDRDARKLAAQLRVPVSGTIGVLMRLVNIRVLSLAEANKLLKKMVDKGYRSPVESLEEL